MSVIVTDAGFAPDDWSEGVVPLADLDRPAEGLAVDVPSGTAPPGLAERLAGATLVRIDFPSFSDGRGFTLARLLRLGGYRGRLRAGGHVIADQYAMARRSGFDEVEIDDDLARRQPEPQWRARASWQAHDYQSRLRARAGG